MKIINRTAAIILFITVLLFNTSCADYLNESPDDELTIEMVFNDKTRTEEWLAGIYSSIPSPYWDYARYAGYDALADDLSPSEGWVTLNWNVINLMKGNWSPQTEWQMYYWSELPKRMRSAYIFLDNVKALPAQNVSRDEVELMKNEARFLIAYYYSLLVETYGPYPFEPGALYDDDDIGSTRIPQAPFNEIVDWIDKELSDVAKNLPTYYTDNSKFGRATSVMCQAVRARLLLFSASDLVNGNADYAGHVNKNGVELFDSQYSEAKWVRAAKACRDLINLANNNGYKLYKEYNADGTIDPFLSYQNMMFTRWSDGNKEILFARPLCNDLFEFDKHCSPRGSGGNGGLSVTQSLVDAFFMKNGYPITDAASGYVEKGFSTASEIRNTRWIEGSPTGMAGEITTANTYNMYCNREPRFYISVLYNGAWYRQSNRRTQFMTNQIDGGPGYDAPQTGYLNRKKVHPDHNSLQGVNPYRPGILYRLGEAYLDYIECALECANRGITVEYFNEALGYWDELRERAGLVPIKTCYPNASVSELLELYRKERRVELNNEGSRFRDLRRWKLAETVLNKTFDAMNMNGTEYDDNENNAKAYFKRTGYFTRVFKKQFYFFPVPSWEMDKNPNLTQNPYWNK